MSNYRYAFQGQEFDKETNMEAFQLRLWDGRIGRWLSPDPAGEFHSPYVGMGNNPIGAVDPDGGDIIYLNDSQAVPGLSGSFGHAAVLIGNDHDGWRYLSKNGTENGREPFGRSAGADLGDEFGKNDFRGTGLTAAEVIQKVNKTNTAHQHNYDRSIRVKTTSTEDEIAFGAANREAAGNTYSILGHSCIDVPQQAFAAVALSRMGKPLHLGMNLGEDGFGFFDAGKYGFKMLIPNQYFDNFGHFMRSINSDMRTNPFKTNPSYVIKVGPVE